MIHHIIYTFLLSAIFFSSAHSMNKHPNQDRNNQEREQIEEAITLDEQLYELINSLPSKEDFMNAAASCLRFLKENKHYIRGSLCCTVSILCFIKAFLLFWQDDYICPKGYECNCYWLNKLKDFQIMYEGIAGWIFGYFAQRQFFQ